MIDAAGRAHEPVPDARILSLVPSLTETLFDLGLGERVVGRTAFCVHPKDEVRAVKSVGGTKQVNWRKIEAARPTHAVLNIDENPREMAEELDRRGIEPVVTHPIAPADSVATIRLLGRVFDAEDRAERLAAELEQALADLAAGAPYPPRRVVYLIWKDPWMTVSRDTYISRFLSLIAWETVGHRPDVRYPEIELTPNLLDAVDLVLFSSEPFPFKDTHLDAFRRDFPPHAAKARAIDGELLSWYGSRAIKGVEYLRGLAAAEGAA